MGSPHTPRSRRTPSNMLLGWGVSLSLSLSLLQHKHRESTLSLALSLCPHMCLCMSTQFDTLLSCSCESFLHVCMHCMPLPHLHGCIDVCICGWADVQVKVCLCVCVCAACMFHEDRETRQSHPQIHAYIETCKGQVHKQINEEHEAVHHDLTKSE